MALPATDLVGFQRYLGQRTGDIDLARRMIALNSAYYFALGLLEGHWANYFESEEGLSAFKLKHNVEATTLLYDSRDFEGVLISELGISRVLAREFSRCEEAWLRLHGILE